MSLFYQYIANENPIGVQNFLASKGVAPSNDVNILSRQIEDVANMIGESCKKDLAALHPDKDLFENSNHFANYSGGGEYSNSCGCSNFSSANGQSTKAEVERLLNGTSTKKDNTDLMILAGTIVIALALILKK